MMVRGATRRYEDRLDCGAEANMAKMLAADASWEAANACTSRPTAVSLRRELRRRARLRRGSTGTPISTNPDPVSPRRTYVLGLPLLLSPARDLGLPMTDPSIDIEPSARLDRPRGEPRRRRRRRSGGDVRHKAERLPGRVGVMPTIHWCLFPHPTVRDLRTLSWPPPRGVFCRRAAATAPDVGGRATSKPSIGSRSATKSNGADFRRAPQGGRQQLALFRHRRSRTAAVIPRGAGAARSPGHRLSNARLPAARRTRRRAARQFCRKPASPDRRPRIVDRSRPTSPCSSATRRFDVRATGSTTLLHTPSRPRAMRSRGQEST